MYPLNRSCQFYESKSIARRTSRYRLARKCTPYSEDSTWCNCNFPKSAVAVPIADPRMATSVSTEQISAQLRAVCTVSGSLPREIVRGIIQDIDITPMMEYPRDVLATSINFPSGPRYPATRPRPLSLSGASFAARINPPLPNISN